MGKSVAMEADVSCVDKDFIVIRWLHMINVNVDLYVFSDMAKI